MRYCCWAAVEGWGLFHSTNCVLCCTVTGRASPCWHIPKGPTSTYDYVDLLSLEIDCHGLIDAEVNVI